jgi:hypothetical protein
MGSYAFPYYKFDWELNYDQELKDTFLKLFLTKSKEDNNLDLSIAFYTVLFNTAENGIYRSKYVATTIKRVDALVGEESEVLTIKDIIRLELDDEATVGLAVKITCSNHDNPDVSTYKYVNFKKGEQIKTIWVEQSDSYKFGCVPYGYVSYAGETPILIYDIHKKDFFGTKSTSTSKIVGYRYHKDKSNNLTVNLEFDEVFNHNGAECKILNRDMKVQLSNKLESRLSNKIDVVFNVSNLTDPVYIFEYTFGNTSIKKPIYVNTKLESENELSNYADYSEAFLDDLIELDGPTDYYELSSINETLGKLGDTTLFVPGEMQISQKSQKANNDDKFTWNGVYDLEQPKMLW